jgi:hypothetical protein
MDPVVVAIDVPQPREEVFAYIDVLANHERFTNHFLVDWTVSGAPRGVGAHVRVRAKQGRANWMEIEALASEPPHRTVEQAVGANGRRVTRGTYVLDELPDGGTRITFTLEWLSVPTAERIAAPLVRAMMRSANQKALERLAGELAKLPAAQ